MMNNKGGGMGGGNFFMPGGGVNNMRMPGPQWGRGRARPFGNRGKGPCS